MNHLITFRSSAFFVAFAAVLAVLLVVVAGRQAGAQTPPDIDTVAIDLDQSGNTATNIGVAGGGTTPGIDSGDIQSSVGSIAIGSTVTFDIVVDAVPSPGIFGVGLEVIYDPLIVEVTGVTAGGPGVLQFSSGFPFPFVITDILPDTDGSFRVDSSDIGGTDETGPGKVVDVTVKCILAGTTAITLTDTKTGGGANAGILNTIGGGSNYTIGNEIEAFIGCGGPVTTPTPVPTPVPTGTLTVNKVFSDVNASSVSVTVTCDGGATVSPSGATAVSEAAPVTFDITLPAGTASCTAAESPVPTGYTESDDCAGVVVNGGGTTNCTITNTPTTTTFTITKDFVPNSTALVNIDIACTGVSTLINGSASPLLGTVQIQEGSPAAVTVTAFDAADTCTVTENPAPTGHVAGTGCTGVPLVQGATACTITNTETTTTITVSKVFPDSNPSAVTIGVSCDSGLVTANDTSASDPAGVAGDATFTVTGFTPTDTCTVSESGVPTGYAMNPTLSDCDEGVTLSAGGTLPCTFVNEPSETTFTINKDFSDNNSASVTVDIACSPGNTLINGNPAPLLGGTVSGGSLVVTVTAFDAGDTCTVTENPVPAGYVADTGCTTVTLIQGTTSCTIKNDAVSTVSVFKDFDDNNQTPVTISLICTTTGTVTPIDNTAVDAVSGEATFTVSGYGSGATCTATETDAPGGYTINESTCTPLTLAAGNTPSCTITNTLNTGTVTVSKNFDDNNTASVTVEIICTGSGTPDQASKSASEATAAVFTVTGFDPGDTCTVTENPVPTGYTKDDSACVNLALSVSGDVACTVLNGSTTATLTVNKAYSDGTTGAVTVALTCTGGNIDSTPKSSAPAAPAIFTITGFTAGAMCSATESVPAGYILAGTTCLDVALVNLGTPSCAITNDAVSTVSVFKDFDDDNQTPVTISLVCTTGTVTPIDNTAVDAVNEEAEFTVSGYGGGASCTATETDAPSEYTVDESTCTPLALTAVNTPSCTITNTLNVATFEVTKIFSNGIQDEVDVTLTCSSGTVADPDTKKASEATPAAFTISGFTTPATCTATEQVPAGFTAFEADCLNVPLTPGSQSTCTIVNTDEVFFQVRKFFDAPTAISVIVTLTCTSGDVTVIDPSANGADPADFQITAFGPGTTCTATEQVPPGWTVDQSDCLNVPINDTECLIINNKIPSTPTPLPTASPQPSPSVLPTPPSPQPTATPTASPTSAPTLAPTPTPTPTPTALPATPTPTDTPTPTPTPTATPISLVWGDGNCSNSADPIDSLLTLRHDAGLNVDTGGCPNFGETINVLGASLHLWGDVDCSGAINPVDSLKLLRADAGLSVSRAANCPEIGSTVQIV